MRRREVKVEVSRKQDMRGADTRGGDTRKEGSKAG